MHICVDTDIVDMLTQTVDIQEVDGAGDGDGRSVLSQYVEMRSAVVRRNPVEIRIIIRNAVRPPIIDSCSYHVSVFRARQVGHQLRRRYTLL